MIYPQLHCGFYLFNNKIYISRQDLLDDILLGIELREKKFGIPHDVNVQTRRDSRATYCFNEPVFKMIDWTLEPSQSLKELYVERCQQLRDKYSYLILSYSGGADSHEILYTFLDNNIFIDEIQVVHYSKALAKFDMNILADDIALRQLLEYETIVKPQLKIIAERSPNTKITLLDASDFTVDEILNNRFDFMGMGKYKETNSTFIVQTTPYTRNFFQQLTNNEQRTFKNNTGFIRGVEKPILNITNNQLRFSFSDASMHTVKLIQKKQVDDIYTIENFFWTPDCPLIPIKQSHVIKRKLETEKEFYATFMLNQERVAANQNLNRSHDNAQNINRKYDELIYYYWNKNMFFAPKHNTESPEFKLVSLIEKNNNALKALDEQNNFFFKKYAKISERRLINKHMFTDPYIIGDLNVTWN
jgi:hypothetical protein